MASGLESYMNAPTFTLSPIKNSPFSLLFPNPITVPLLSVWSDPTSIVTPMPNGSSAASSNSFDRAMSDAGFRYG